MSAVFVEVTHRCGFNLTVLSLILCDVVELFFYLALGKDLLAGHDLFFVEGHASYLQIPWILLNLPCELGQHVLGLGGWHCVLVQKTGLRRELLRHTACHLGRKVLILDVLLDDADKQILSEVIEFKLLLGLQHVLSLCSLVDQKGFVFSLEFFIILAIWLYRQFPFSLRCNF